MCACLDSVAFPSVGPKWEDRGDSGRKGQMGKTLRYLGMGRKEPGAALETCPCVEQ